MKKIVLLLFCFFTLIQGYCQSDSAEATPENYKRNIQLNTLGVIGYFSVQYEQAFSTHMSMSLIATVNYNYLGLYKPHAYNTECIPQLRYYFNKGTTYNKGFYLSASVNMVYQRSYSGFLINNKIVDKTTHEHIDLFAGGGLGYQWIIHNRLIIDIGFSYQRAFYHLLKSDATQDSNHWKQVQYVSYSDRNSYMPVSVNIGYTF